MCSRLKGMGSVNMPRQCAARSAPSRRCFTVPRAGGITPRLDPRQRDSPLTARRPSDLLLDLQLRQYRGSLAFTGEPAQGAEEVAGTKRRRVMKRAANTAVIALLALVALAGASAAVPSSVTAAGLIYACVNNSSGTIHVVSETGACSNNEVRLVWANQDQVGALQQAVATLQAQIAAAGHALTSPNGQYSVGVADDGIVLEGPGVSIRLDAGDPASPTPTVTVSGRPSRWRPVERSRSKARLSTSTELA